MTDSGPDPEGSGPESSPDLERARRRLYRSGGADPGAVAEYERLAGEAARLPAAPGPARSADGAPTLALAPGRRRSRTVPLVGAALAAAALVAIAVVTTRPAPPQQPAAPELAGSTLLVYGRAPDPDVAPGQVTYQPEGYTVFQPRGRTVAVAVRCVGEGRVHISAGEGFDFRCSGEERAVSRRDTGPRSAPFVVVGTTTGDVAWTARIVLLDPPQTAGAIPTFRDACADCLSR